MTGTKRDGNADHGFLAPVAMIVVLLTGYWLISEWHTLPSMISSALATIQYQ